jgi:hypothetical protein
MMPDAFDTIDNACGRIRRLSALIRSISDSQEGWDSDDLDDDAKAALGELAEIIGDSVAVIRTGMTELGGIVRASAPLVLAQSTKVKRTRKTGRSK